MPVSTQQYTRRPLGGDPIHQELTRLPSGFLNKLCFPTDANGDRVVWPGLVVSEVQGGLEEGEMTGSQPYYVPYSSSAAYGTGSDTAVGVLRERIDATVTDWQITPVDVGIAYEARCYVGGGALGDISAAIKTNLSRMKWR